jgi:hypothetical protein
MSYRIGPDIAQHLAAWGLTVVPLDGWRGRGHSAFPAKPLVIVAHHTGTPDSAKGDYPTKNVVINGRSDLKGPLCNFGLGRNGTVYLVADGVAWHAGQGAWDGIDVGNEHSVGIEAESAGTGHWTPQQLTAYPLLSAALCDYFSIPPKRVCAHRESALPHGRKDDPVGIDMPSFRARVQQLLTTHQQSAVHAETAHQPTPLPTQEHDMVVIYAPGKPLALLAAGKLTALESNAEKDALVAAGVPFKQITAAQFGLIQKVATR